MPDMTININEVVAAFGGENKLLEAAAYHIYNGDKFVLPPSISDKITPEEVLSRVSYDSIATWVLFQAMLRPVPLTAWPALFAAKPPDPS